MYWIDNVLDKEAKRICPPKFDKSREVKNENLEQSHKRVYDYALAMTEKELAQGVEGLLHNLNSL